MREVIEESVRLMQDGRPCVLATVVRTKGMTPQKSGAKLLIREDGTAVGTLGGGCVEGDIWYYAKEMLKTGGGPQYRSYHLNADIAAKDGLVCGGTMYFFMEPLHATGTALPLFTKIVDSYLGQGPVAVATLVEPGDSAIEIGTKVQVEADGSLFGTTGEKALDDRIADVGVAIARTAQNQFIEWSNGAEVYIEGFTQPPMVVVLGGGHVGAAIYELALKLDFAVCIIDDREEFANQERFPDAETIVADYDEGLRRLAPAYNSFIVVATRGHRYDDAATKAAMQTAARYVGLLGSPRKNLLIFRELLAGGVDIDRISQIHAPIGLNIGALTPYEIAVSILAEIIQCIRGGDGRPLKTKSESLLERIRALPEPENSYPF